MPLRAATQDDDGGGTATFSIIHAGRRIQCNEREMKTRKPSIVLLIGRVIVLTFLLTALAFALALFGGIVGLALLNLKHGVNMAFAHRHVALPVAVVAGVVVFLGLLANEIREYRRSSRSAVARPPDARMIRDRAS